MQILFISSWYPTESNPFYGVFVKEHSHAIHSTGNNIIVIALVIHRGKCIWQKKIVDFVDEGGVRTILIEINTKFRNIVYHAFPLQYLLIKSIYKKLLDERFEPDIIHSNVIFPSGIIGYFLSKYAKKKHIITEHWSRIKYFSCQPILSYWGRKAYNQADKILPVSVFLQNVISKSFNLASPRKFEVIGNVVDSTLFNYKAKHRENNLIRLCAIASWNTSKVPAKQPELLFKAISEIQKKNSCKVVLTMVGGGDKIETLKQLSCQLGINTNFTGYLPKEKIAKILHNSDYLVHPTLVETFGIVVVESLLTGTPVICSNVGALPELINKENGFLCKNTVEDWVQTLEKGMNTLFDGKMVTNSVKGKFDKEIIGKKIANIYENVMIDK